jgi:hypothetical protein
MRDEGDDNGWTAKHRQHKDDALLIGSIGN